MTKHKRKTAALRRGAQANSNQTTHTAADAIHAACRALWPEEVEDV